MKGVKGFQKGNKLGHKFECGEEHWNWRGGRYVSGHNKKSTKYVTLSLDGKKVREHVLVAEKMIGRKLHPNEIVHHKNGDGTDNRHDNLEVMDKTEHLLMHHRLWLESKKEDTSG